jgi:sugar phosphate isomerase/epimerase
MPGRRSFIRTMGLGSLAVFAPAPAGLGNALENWPGQSVPLLSLAQWSLHRSLTSGVLRPEDFPRVAQKDFQIDAVEYVNQFYKEHLNKAQYWHDLRRQTDALGVRNLLIMIDDEGLLADPSKQKRQQAVSRHMKWVEVARILGCHSIRVNAFGQGEAAQLRSALVDGLGRLAKGAEEAGISILVENHGFHTSNAGFMVGILKEIDHPGLGTLPDFGNWCLNREWGSTQSGSCTQNYGPVRGLKEFLPFAGGVSAKAYDFDAAGNETLLPYRELLQTVKDAGFKGHIGIEYEGSRLSEADGIRATKALIERIWPQLS